MKYSDLLLDWLRELGYRKCFFVAGGNIMHLLESARHRFDCRCFVHEVAAGIAAEYFNEVGSGERAFLLVTAGPGLTNCVSAMGGAFLESRELLVIGGQVKSADLATGGLRQRGIQEIDGRAIVAPITVLSERLEAPVPKRRFVEMAEAVRAGRPGPAFIEICLDAQGAPITEAKRAELEGAATVAAQQVPMAPAHAPAMSDLARLHDLLANAERPILLLGGGVSRAAAAVALPGLAKSAMPIVTTWNGADRIPADHPSYFGRPNTWGQRYSNILLQQADLVLALGTRLGMQQTGFNWEGFAPVARVVQVDIDAAELAKGHPRIDLPIRADADLVLADLAARSVGPYTEWRDFCRRVRQAIPLVEDGNVTGQGYISPYVFVARLSEVAGGGDVVIPCSSGGAFTVMMQAFAQKAGQRIVTNKGLAAMGYGLSGAIGAAMALPSHRVILVEGDGGFSQNLQELGTVAAHKLDLKIFIFDDGGYASIRMTQRNYFGGAYIGCDRSTGLGLPDWPALCDAYGIPSHQLSSDFPNDDEFQARFAAAGPSVFVVPIDPEQTYFPKITSRVTETGSMVSNPLHAMTPPLPDAVAELVYRFVPRP